MKKREALIANRRGDIAVTSFVNLAKILLVVGFIGVLLLFLVFGKGEQKKVYSELEARELAHKLKYPPMLLSTDYRGMPEPVINWSRVESVSAVDCSRTGNAPGCVTVKPHDYCIEIECSIDPLAGKNKKLGNQNLCDQEDNPKEGIRIYEDSVPVYDPSSDSTGVCTITIVVDMRA